MRIVVPRETAPGEQRVALVPESCKKLIRSGYEIAVEAGRDPSRLGVGRREREVGEGARGSDAPYVAAAGASIREPEIAVGPGRDEPGNAAMPLRHLEMVRALADRRVTAFATDAIPRTTRAQAMDTLSSMANIAGYKGVLLAAVEFNRYFPMLMTAAGMVAPARVFVIGAGVAGLQAIATAKRLGATVVATDVRPEVKEQIESVGAKYVGIELKQSAAAGGGYAAELSAEDRRR